MTHRRPSNIISFSPAFFDKRECRHYTSYMSFRRIALIILLIVVVISLSLLAWKVISDDNNQEAIA